MRLPRWYDEHVFPWILQAVESPVLRDCQAAVVAQARGRVLEVGFGTGQSLSWYGEEVDELVAVEPSAGMLRRAAPRLEATTLPVRVLQEPGEALSLPDDHVDTAVILLTLCSVGSPTDVLAEVARVLRPGGTLLFLEHVLSPSPRTAAWQRRLDPLEQALGAGCSLTRDTPRLVAEAGFQELELEPADVATPALWPIVRGRARAP